MKKIESTIPLMLSDILHELGRDEVCRGLDIEHFSADTTLHDYQIAAVKNALKAIDCYMNDRYKLIESYKHKLDSIKDMKLDFMRGLEIGFDSKNTRYSKDTHPLTPFAREGGFLDSIHSLFARASFWMATGSGKSIVMIKLIALLFRLMRDKALPLKPLMLLAPNEYILNQFRSNIALYNRFNADSITIRDLKEYESGMLPHISDTLYICRSDLLDIADNVGKDGKRLNYRNFITKEGFIILLDEAHKGDSRDSVRKKYINELGMGLDFLESIESKSTHPLTPSAREGDSQNLESKNAGGFIFNFSATFEDDIDFITCAFNYNLREFNTHGYGKNIAVLDSNLKSFKDSASEEEQIERILESFIIFNAIKQSKDRIFNEFKNLALKYHNPLIIAVSDKVNTEDAGIRQYFKAILSIIKNEINIKNIAQNLYEKLKEQRLHFGENALSEEFLESIRDSTNKSVRENVFYASENAGLEALKIKGNTKEIAFKSKNASKAFMLLNIGEARGWEREFLGGLGVESVSDIDKGFFANINNADSSINIMLGSKVFSEGWDSNRVNMICFINIGSKKAKKYVLQTIGRGVRIEPFNNIRKRVGCCDKIKDFGIMKRVSSLACGLESLFVMATKNDAIDSILKELDKQNRSKIYKLHGFKKNKILDSMPVPKYAESATLDSVYKISKKEASDLKAFVDSYDEDVLLMQYALNRDFCYSTMQEIDRFFESKSHRIKESGNEDKFSKKNTLYEINRVLNTRAKRLSGFEEVGEKIVHFTQMQILDAKIVDSINQKIKEMINIESKSMDEIKKDIEKEFKSGKITFEEAMESTRLATQQDSKKTQNIGHYRLSVKLARHYYLPLILFDDEYSKSAINYAISNKSEREFLADLEGYIKGGGLSEYEWCFSRVVENIDDIYIPYFDTLEQCERRFYPDFIFWLKDRNNDFRIYFIDPKGLNYEANSRDKARGFEAIFDNQNLIYNDKNIKVHLIYYNKSQNTSSDIAKYVKSSVDEVFVEI